MASGSVVFIVVPFYEAKINDPDRITEMTDEHPDYPILIKYFHHILCCMNLRSDVHELHSFYNSKS